MKISYLILVSLFPISQSALGGCIEPFGTYVSKPGKTTLRIEADQTVQLFFPNTDLTEPSFEGKFKNFDELKGTIFHNYENAIIVEQDDQESSYMQLHISEDCKIIKGGPIHRGNGPFIKTDGRLFTKND